MTVKLSDRRRFLIVTAMAVTGTTAGCLADNEASDADAADADIVLSTELSGNESETFETGEATEYEVTITPEGSRAKFGIREDTIAPTSLDTHTTTDGESTFDLELESERQYEVTALGGTFELTISDGP